MNKTIIAEIGSVHDGSFGNACKLIESAADCGASIVKFQHHIADEEMIVGAKNPKYFNDEPRFEYFKRIEFRPDEIEKLMNKCKDLKIEYLCSPFSIRSVEVLEDLNINSYKIASGEVTNIFLLERIAKTKKKVYLSTGMSNWNDIDEAIKILNNNELVVMQCSSVYPCPEESVGLNNLNILRKRYNKEIGFSDHSTGFAAAFAAAALGANVIEKHFTFSRLMYGSDAQFAMDPQDFKKFCYEIKRIWKILDHPVNKDKIGYLKDMKNIFEKSLVISKDLKKGHIISKNDLNAKKPGNGIPINEYKKIIGKKLKKNTKKNYQLKPSDFCS